MRIPVYLLLAGLCSFSASAATISNIDGFGGGNGIYNQQFRVSIDLSSVARYSGSGSFTYTTGTVATTIGGHYLEGVGTVYYTAPSPLYGDPAPNYGRLGFQGSMASDDGLYSAYLQVGQSYFTYGNERPPQGALLFPVASCTYCSNMLGSDFSFYGTGPTGTFFTAQIAYGGGVPIVQNPEPSTYIAVGSALLILALRKRKATAGRTARDRS